MKKIFLVILAHLFLFPTINLYPQYTEWENISDQIPGDSTNNLSDVSGLSRWVGWISSGSKPEIYRSIFSPGIWEVLKTPSPVTAFYIIDYDYGFMCGVDSAVYQTTDAGETWAYFGSLGEPINDIDFTYDYSFNGYICGNDGAVGSIADTGMVDLNSGLTVDFSSISSPEEDKVWLLGDSLIYYYDGSSFNKKFVHPFLLHSVLFANELYGWVVGDSGYIAVTSDGGNNWRQKQNPDTLKRNLNDINLVGRYGWVVGDDGLILKTIDAGETWIIDNDWLTPNKLVNVQDGGLGPALAVGENKTALIYPIVVSVDDKQIINDDFELFQNYPNPFNPNTTIKYQIQRLYFVTLKVYDVLGNYIATLVNEEKLAGKYEVEFDGSALTSGIYFYQIKAGFYKDTKKMILLR